MASFWDMLTGKSAADAANRAAADQYAKQQSAGNTYAGTMSDLATSYDPYRAGGGAAQDQVYSLLGLNGSNAQDAAYQQFRTDPGYQFQMDQGINAIQSSAANKGNLNSGRTLKALQSYGQGMADQSYNNYLTRLMGLGQQGLGATQAAVGTAAQGAGGQFQANYGSAPTIGQGMVAGAQSQQNALGNLLGAGSYLAGAALGGPVGSALGNLMGGSRQSSYTTSNPWMVGSPNRVPIAGIDF